MSRVYNYKLKRSILLNASFLRERNATAAARCLKITEKVSSNIASEASYVYILSGQKLIKNAKNCSFWRILKT